MRALVVDDDRVVLASCQRVLAAEGFGVCLAPSARAALDAMARERLDLAIIDVKMPERDGLWLIRQLLDQRPSLPIIVMSGYAVPEVIQEGLAQGAALFLAKPFTPEELLASVQTALKKGGAP
jgi:DNA-binding response OmpR family regulator